MAAEFSKGQRVSLKKNVAQKGRVDNIHPPQGGYQFYEVLMDDGNLIMIPEHDLVPEVIIKTPWDLLANNSLSDYRDFSIATTLHKVRNTTSNTISSLKASRTIFYPYQYKPLVKFLKSDLKRILVADEVGLGKTIEAGHIMLEMAARGDLRNALVICTNSLRDKWKNELEDKFNFVITKYDSPKEFIQAVQNDVAANKKSIFGVLNYEKCRNVKLQKIIEENSYRFDLLICDEAHKIRNSETAQHKGIAKIVDHSDAVVFLTATPIMTDIRNLHNLIRVLDREGYDTFDIFNNAISQNRPFIQALSQLNANIPLKNIANELHSTSIIQEMTVDEEVYFSVKKTIAELFQNDALYQRARENMLYGADSIENRVKIQKDLIDLNSLNHIYTRTRKREVMNSDKIVNREPHTVKVTLSEEEREIFNTIINEYGDPKNLGLIQRKRQMSSSIVAFLTNREKLLVGEYDKQIPDAKFQDFKTIVEYICKKNGKKLIVFAFFTDTLLYLKIKLREMGIQTEIIYGAIEDRTERLNNFQHNDKVKVLLSSEIGSEGIDLQFCDALVNYDLPWNPMIVEQRIGRIDRVGQQSEVINIYNLVIKDTIEERIHDRLYERIKLFKESLGDLEEILGESEPLGDTVSKGIEFLYRTKLSKNEIDEKLDQIRKAIEFERQTLKDINKDLASAFANDMHFQHEIENITKNNRYLTKEEIIKYIEAIIRIELSSLRLHHKSENNAEIEIPENSKSLLFDFIEKYKDSATVNPELESLYRKFKRNLGSRKISLTFDQKHAYEYKTLEYISAFHPLVNAITNYFAEHGYGQNQAHKIQLSINLIDPEKRIGPGYYILAIYRISIMRDSGDGKTNQLHFMKSALADINSDKVQMINNEISDHIYGLVQLQGEQFHSTISLNREFVDAVRPAIMMEMKKEEIQFKDDEEVKFLSAIRRRTEQEVHYIDSRVGRIESMLKEGKGIEAILRKELEEFRLKRNRLIEAQAKAKIEVSHSFISANILELV